MSHPTDRNRLDEEASPYLRQHADNPVNWQPWDDRALEAAREDDVPIFLSIGYSACHWCHVMESESFEDEDVADVLNEHFVPIKVDREERPDLDRIYQTICQLVSGRGGWPLSVWLTPEGKPFYVGTYFPKEPKRGAPGFLDLLGNIVESWREDRTEIETRAEQWTDAVTEELESTPETGGEPPESGVLGDAAAAAIRSADREYGGFGESGPKFPQPGRIDLLLRAGDRGDGSALAVARETLDAMADGGMYDHVGGGFHRYATDRKWTVPHFEKMLYDNAELPRLYLAAHQAIGDPRYASVARETFEFLQRELTHPDGGFYATLDAQSRPPESRGSESGAGSGAGSEAGSETGSGAESESKPQHESEEGAFYVWTPEEIRAVLDDDTVADLVCKRYGVTRGGNFERGTTVLTVSATIPELAEEYDLDEETVRETLADARERLFDAREERPRPRRDEKVLAGWNGLAISAFATGARVLDASLAEPARDALAFVRRHLWAEDEGRLRRRYKDGDVKGEGYLEDYAFLARGAFDLYQVTGEVDHLAFAIDLARVIESEFWEPAAGTLYFTPESGEQLVTRPQELHDQSTPSSLGVATNLLLDLDAFAPDADFESIAGGVLETHADRVRGRPLEHVSLVIAADRYDSGPVELTIASDDVPPEWQDTLAETYLPGVVVAPRPATDADLEAWLDVLDLDETPPIWNGRTAADGEPTAYACEAFTCSPPQSEIDAALEWLSERRGRGSTGEEPPI